MSLQITYFEGLFKALNWLLLLAFLASVSGVAKSDALLDGKFAVEISKLPDTSREIMSAGIPANDAHPKIHLLSVRRTADAAQKFPDVSSCLNVDDKGGVLDLTKVATQKIDSPSEFSVCIQRIGNLIDTPADLSDWLTIVGFESIRLVENDSATWAALGQPEMTGGHSIAASWRKKASMLGKPYPMSLKFSLQGNDLASNFSVSLIFDSSGKIFDVRSAMITL